MEKEELLAEIEDTLRTMPPRATIRHETPENLAWFGRVSAAIEKWNPAKSVLVKEYCDLFFSNGHARETGFGLTKLLALLNQAQHDVRMETVGPTTVSIPHKSVFEYFDEIRTIIELAKQDLLFVDPYLDAEFVSRYLPHASAGVIIRLLAREKLATLLPAIDAFARQNGTSIQVRSAPNFTTGMSLLIGWTASSPVRHSRMARSRHPQRSLKSRTPLLRCSERTKSCGVGRASNARARDKRRLLGRFHLNREQLPFRATATPRPLA